MGHILISIHGVTFTFGHPFRNKMKMKTPAFR